FNSISFSDASGTLRTQTRISTFPSRMLWDSGSRRAVALYVLVHQFRQVNGGHLSFHACDLNGVFYVHHAKRTGSDDYVGARIGRHADSFHTHSFVLFGLVEQHQPAATAAE